MRWCLLLLLCVCVIVCSAQVQKTTKENGSPQAKPAAASAKKVKETASKKEEDPTKKTDPPKKADPQKPADPPKKADPPKQANPPKPADPPIDSAKKASASRTLKSTNDPNHPDGSEPVLVKSAASIVDPTTTVGKDGGKTKDPANILVMLPMPFYSHTNNFMPIFKELARRGHNITMVSPYPPKEDLPNWEHIVVENVLDKFLAQMGDMDLTAKTGLIGSTLGLYFMSQMVVPLALKMPEVVALFKDNTRKYDVVIAEAQFVQEPLIAFGYKFGAPIITIFPTVPTPEVLYYTGNPVLTSTYVPNLQTPISNRMSFLERVENVASTVLKLLAYNLLHVPSMDKMMREHFSADLPYLGDMLTNISFTLCDTNLALNYPYPRANNMREFLGINAKHSSDLTPELQEFMDGADEGVVYFTLGSHFKTSSLKPYILTALTSAFARLPQKVLMKWDGENLPPNLSDNVFTAKWFPQPGILNHRNCKAFLTHTGAHGLMEAMDHGIPVISIPLFADQRFYARWASEQGVGSVIDIDTVTPESAFKTMTEVLNTPKYKANAVEMSRKLRDVPISPLAEAVHWVEYVHRTKGARDLRPAAVELAWYQRFGVDVLALALTAVLVPIFVLVALLKCCINICCKSSPKKKLKKN